MQASGRAIAEGAPGHAVTRRAGLGACRALFGLALLAACSGAAAQARTLSLEPVADATIFTGEGYEELSDGAGPHLWTSITAGGFSRRALLRFDLSAVPPGSRVLEARLTLFHSRSLAVDTVAMHRLLAPWGEGTSNAGTSGAGAAATPGSVTWRHRFFPSTLWAAPGGDHAPAASATISVGGQSEFYSWGTTPQTVADVQAWVNNPSANHGWLLIGGESGDRRGKRYESRENATPVNRPRLVVVHEPAPATAAPEGDIPLPPWALLLLALGVGGALLRRRT